MMTALDLVPGITPKAIVPQAYRFYHTQPLLNPALIDEVRRHLIFDTGPHLIRVDKREARFTSIGPGTQQQTSLIIQDIGALAVDMILEAGAKVVLVDRADG